MSELMRLSEAPTAGRLDSFVIDESPSSVVINARQASVEVYDVRADDLFDGVVPAEKLVAIPGDSNNVYRKARASMYGVEDLENCR